MTDICLFGYISVYLSTNISIYLFYLDPYHPLHLLSFHFICLVICFYTCLSIYPSILLPIYLSLKYVFFLFKKVDFHASLTRGRLDTTRFRSMFFDRTRYLKTLRENISNPCSISGLFFFIYLSFLHHAKCAEFGVRHARRHSPNKIPTLILFFRFPLCNTAPEAVQSILLIL